MTSLPVSAELHTGATCGLCGGQIVPDYPARPDTYVHRDAGDEDCKPTTAARHRNWQVALDALVEDAPACGLDPFKIRKRAERIVSAYKSDRTRYDVIRHMHDAMLAEAHR